MRIDRFHVLGPLAGAADGVLAAWDPELERKVAIERWTDVAGDDARAAALARARAIARLAHPNVVRVHEVGQHEGGIFVARELVGTSSLVSWCAARPEHTRARFIALSDLAIQAARGLAAAHAAGVVVGALDARALAIDESGRLRLSGLAGAAVDAATDRRALCETLWEAALGGADGEPTATQRRGVAPWFLAVLRRGRDPKSGWSDTDALRDALERGRGRRRRRLALLLGSIGMIAVASFALRPPPPDPCRASRAATSPWSGDARRALQDHLTSGGTPSAIASFASVERRLDHFERRWDEEYFAACESARVPAGDDDPLRSDDARLACLDEVRASLAVVVDEIGRLDRDRLGSATALTLALPDPLRCRDRTIAPAAHDVALRLARAGTLVNLRRLVEVAPLLAELAEQGWGGNANLECRGRLVLSLAAYSRGDFATSYDEARRALTLAEYVDDPESEAESWSQVAQAELALSHHDAADFAAARAISVAQARGIPLVIVEALRIRGGVEVARGRPELALASMRAAEQLVLRHRGPRDPSLARIYGDLVRGLVWAGRLDEAVATARSSVALYEDLLGPDSPHTVRAVGVLGFALAERGETDEAIEVLGRAAKGFERDPSASPHDLSTARLKHAEQLAFARRYDEALAELDQLGGLTDDPELSRLVEMTRAMALMESGRVDEAVASYTALLARFAGQQDHFGAFNRAVLHVNLALALARAGRDAEALALVEPTIAEYRALDRPDARIAGAMAELAEVHRLAGRHRDAIALCERALALLGGKETSALARGRAELGLARAFVGLGDAALAREHALLAAKSFYEAHDRRAAADAEAIAR